MNFRRKVSYWVLFDPEGLVATCNTETGVSSFYFQPGSSPKSLYFPMYDYGSDRHSERVFQSVKEHLESLGYEIEQW